jgi:hypothetical protein
MGSGMGRPLTLLLNKAPFLLLKDFKTAVSVHAKKMNPLTARTRTTIIIKTLISIRTSVFGSCAFDMLYLQRNWAKIARFFTTPGAFCQKPMKSQRGSEKLQTRF